MLLTAREKAVEQSWKKAFAVVGNDRAALWMPADAQAMSWETYVLFSLMHPSTSTQFLLF